MAVGGHHGGGFHSGGHHSSGGFHGGGFSGGGGGGGHYYGGSDDGAFFDVKLFLYVIAFLIFIVYKIGSGEVPGVDFLVVGMVSASVIFFYNGLKEYDRTSMISEVKRNKGQKLFGQIWKGYATPKTKTGNNRTWATKYGDYRISFFDPDFGDENVQKVKDLIKRTPKIIWMSPLVWLVIAIICFFSIFFFYEFTIPVFENMVMTDEAFEFIDNFIFYLPSSIILLSSIACWGIGKIKDNLLYKCAVRIVEDNIATEEKLKTKEGIAEILNKKWYYNFCPNCGALAVHALRICTSCGSSLEVKDFNDSNISAIHQISSTAKIDAGKSKGKEGA